uniref:Uncharacterized protein n=1 Tax=Schistosoma japonicum TaxID=6182 RepID=Q5BZS4_SCHJA|nr:unknown [Schistosoma japonicum]
MYAVISLQADTILIEFSSFLESCFLTLVAASHIMPNFPR